MTLWYSYNPEVGYETWASAAAAEADAESRLEYHRDRSPDGWHESVRDIEWGMLLPFAEARQVNVVETPGGEHDYTCDYELCAVHDAQNAALVELGQACTKAIEERDEARAKRDKARDCGQEGVCALSPGCCRHWEERNRELVNERDELKRLLLIAVDNGGASIRIWQCSECREAFSGNYKNKCPSCNSVGYWSGSVDPEARKKLEERDPQVRDVMKIQAIVRESK